MEGHSFFKGEAHNEPYPLLYHSKRLSQEKSEKFLIIIKKMVKKVTLTEKTNVNICFFQSMKCWKSSFDQQFL